MTEVWLLILLFVVACLLFATFRVAAVKVGMEATMKPSEEPEERMISGLPSVFLSTIPATERQKRFALLSVLILFGLFAILAPFANIDLPVIQAFTPTGDALLCVIYMITSMILIGQFRQLRTWSLLILASGFMFQSFVTVVHAISFPGFVTDAGILSGPQTTSWLYVLWRGGFPLFVIAYSICHARRPRVPVSPTIALITALSLIFVLVMGFTILIGSFHSYLPAVIVDNDFRMMVSKGISPVILALQIIALVTLWWNGDSILDVWMMVATCTTILDVTISAIIGTERFDLSYYAGRGFGLISAGFILGALIAEMNMLYARLYKMMEEQKQESEARYKSIVDTATDAIVVIDEVGIVQSVNASAMHMFGYPAEEVIGQNVKMLMPEPYQSSHDDFLTHYRETGERQIIGIGREILGKRKDLTLVALDLSVAEWYSSGKRFFTGMLRDISERKRMEQQLIQSQKMEAIGQLTGGMAHDFNNILGVVVGNLDMLADHFPDGSPIELTEAIDATTVGADLVQRLLAFARRQPLQPKTLRIEEVVANMTPLLRRIIGGQIEIETSYDEELFPVIADPAQYENALINLVINARDAMPKGGILSIEVKNYAIDEDSALTYEVPLGTYTTLVVSDNGIGIPKEILPRVFDPFFTTKPPGMGSGLGLSMVFGYAKQSGGFVRIYSELDRGTSVRLYMPSVSEFDQAISEPNSATDTSDLHGNERILVVEDTNGARIVAQRILVSLGYSVKIARDAKEALSILDSGEQFDMLFTDIIMPGQNGVALANEVKKRYPLIKVLLASGFSRTTQEDVIALRATFITKPYRKYELAKTLRQIFSTKEGAISL